MMPKKPDLPPSYINLGFDGEPVAGPSAPAYNENDRQYKVDVELVEAGPSAPTANGDDSQYSASSINAPGPSAPIFGPNPGPATLKCKNPTLVFEDIYEICMGYVRDHCCYGSRFVRQMKLTEINNGCAFHYILDSFGEKRESGNSVTPYRGQSIDGPENGSPPDPWDMVVRLPTLFQDSSTREEIPHTAYVRTCDECHGSGEVRCHYCYGRGEESCGSCSGSGRDSEDNSCSSCSGSGTVSCWKCSGRGEVTCDRCDGHKKLKHYKVLIVTWKNHPVSFMSGIYNLPSHKLLKVTGDRIFFEEKEQLLPIVNAPDVSVNVASTRIVESHKTAFPSELIRKQRHSLRAIPFTRVRYEWKDRMGEFYIYGREKEVYFEDYPQQCCCCTCC